MGLAVIMAAGLVGAVGAVPEAASAATARIAYTCGFPSGKTALNVAVTATFPGAITTGKPFQPSDVGTAVTIPHAALADLGDAGSVAASTQLTVKVAQGGQSADAQWVGDAPATAVPATGDLTLTATGDVPTVTVHGDTAVAFTASDLDLTLTPSGSAGKPVSITCAPDAGEPTVLARVPMAGSGEPSATPTRPGGATATPSASASRGPRRTPRGAITPGLGTPGARSPEATRPLARQIDVAAYQKCADVSTYPPFSPFQLAAFVGGYANVRKVDASATIGSPEPAMARSPTGEGLRNGSVDIDGHHYACAMFTSELDDNGERSFPLTTATTSAFGFVPVTATAHIRQVGEDPLKIVMYQEQGLTGGSRNLYSPYTIVSTASVSLSLSGLRVNGVPLDVGPACRTNGPLYTKDAPIGSGHDQIVTSGGDVPGDPAPIFSQILFGGAQDTDVTIPPFTGCVTPNGDNLDKLLTATVSGSGNYSKLVNGQACPGAVGCKVGVVEPVQSSLWTITHGGSFRGDSPMSIDLAASGTVNGGVKPHSIITCPAASVAGTAYNVSGPPRGDPVILRWPDISGCVDDSGHTWTVKQEGSAGFSGVQYRTATGDVLGRGIAKFVLDRTSGDRCTLTLTGTVGVIYTNATGKLDIVNARQPPLGTGEALRVAESTCTDFPSATPIPAQPLNIIYTLGIAEAHYVLPAGEAFTMTSP